MFYIAPLLIITFSLFGIFFILWRKAKSFSGKGGDSLVYPEIEDSKFFPNHIPKEVEDDTSPNRREPEGFLFSKSFNSAMKNLIRHLLGVKSLFSKVTGNVLSVTKLRRVKVKVNKIEEKPLDSLSGPSKEYTDIEVKVASSSPLLSLKDDSSEFDEQYWIDVLKQDSQSSFPYKKLGEIYTVRGDFREARTVLKYALKLDPQDEETKFKLAELRGKRTKRVS